jgi:hypothetical protein
MKNYLGAINFEQLQHSACEKLLGIKIDSNLNRKNQIDQILNQGNFFIQVIFCL